MDPVHSVEMIMECSEEKLEEGVLCPTQVTNLGPRQRSLGISLGEVS